MEKQYKRSIRGLTTDTCTKLAQLAKLLKLQNQGEVIKLLVEYYTDKNKELLEQKIKEQLFNKGA